MKNEDYFHELIEKQNPERKARGWEKLKKFLEEEKKKPPLSREKEEDQNIDEF